VKAQNARSTAILQADPTYQKDYDAILRVMDATDRIPYGDLDHQYLFNFWQDAQHPRESGGAPASRITRKRRPTGHAARLGSVAAEEHENWCGRARNARPR